MIAVQLRYQYRVYPAPGQVLRARRVFGCKRVVWNDGLSRIAPVKASNRLLGNPHTRLAEGPYLQVPKSLDLSKELITAAKKTKERSWLSDAPVGVLQQALRDLDKAWAAHEDSKTGNRKGPKAAPPRFKSKKDNRQSARFTTSDRFKILDDGSLRLPKIGDVRVKWTRDLPSAPTSVTLIEDRSGRYWVSFVVETEPADDILPPIDGDQGLDLGLIRFAVLADGSHIASPKYLRRAEKKHDAGWARFLSFCQYKATRRGRTFIKVPRDFPSSQMCSACGHRDGPKPLSVRTWTCSEPTCGAVHDRDWNAGKNVRYQGRSILTAAKTPPTPEPGARRRQRHR